MTGPARRGPGVVPGLPLAAARRIALAAQGFAADRPGAAGTVVDRRHVRRVFDRLGLVQIDSVNVLVRSQELPLFARLGPHRRDLLARMLAGRELFEYWGHEAALLPIHRHPLFRWKMRQGLDRAWPGLRRLAREHPGVLAEVLAEVAERGPIAASELSRHHRRTGSWWGWGPGKQALELLFWTGQLSVARRTPAFERVYDLTERVVPAEVLALPTPDEATARRELLTLAARSLGVATERCLADYYRLDRVRSRPVLAEMVADGTLERVEVEGWREPAYLDPRASRPRQVEARALLSPFDPVVWERRRAELLFGFRYRIEIYTPAHRRQHGYYVLPFLLGDRLVARVDLKADRRRGVLCVQSAHAEDHADPRSVAGPLLDELRLMAGWLGLPDGVEVTDRGDLAPALRALVPPPRTAGGRPRSSPSGAPRASRPPAAAARRSR